MKASTHRQPGNQGFALVVTLSLMILLTVIAVGLLSLSSISLRSSSSGEAQARAFANARLAVMMAIGELQKEAGDDRRITADASILSKASQPHLVGTWGSWSPRFDLKPDQNAPDYNTPKTDLFRTWLASTTNPAAQRKREWAETTVDPKWPRLFTVARDGFDLSAATVPTPRGGLAWVVSQENTKAKINVGGPETETAVNVALQAQRRPSLGLSKSLQQPKDGWNLRAGRVLSVNQIKLDTDLASNPANIANAGASYTVHARGLLTDAVNGGLKTDLNLGFELGDDDFNKEMLDGIPNPFRASTATGSVAAPGSYKGQRPLFRPLVENPIVSNVTDYKPVYVADRFYAASVPTFNHLRSYYRIPYHLYGGNSPTVAERGADHVAAKVPPPTGQSLLAPANQPSGTDGSVLGIRPILNRMIYYLSASLDAQDKVVLILTPIISLWNPYNTALDIEGAVAYPWMDMPFQMLWEFKLSNGSSGRRDVNMSEAMGKQFENASPPHGRSINPFFLCELTANGDGNISKPIHFEPGEVRLFVPSSTTPVKFIRKGSNAQRTVRLRAVDDITQMNSRGGLAIPMEDVVANHGFSYVVKQSDQVALTISESSKGSYNYFVSLEDAARIKNPSDTTRGRAITEVQVFKFASAVSKLGGPPVYWKYQTLKASPQALGVIETFHRTALPSVGGQPNSDLTYTTNPRHSSINHQLAAGTFQEAPHFQSTLRSRTSFDGVIDTSVEGGHVCSLWGPSHEFPDGKIQLPFFEIPREPLLSLAAFQHADLASSTYSPANQFANSWASPYMGLDRAGYPDVSYVKRQAGDPPLAIKDIPIYDTSYLTNESLWDGFFFSGAAPTLKPATTGSPATAWKSDIAQVEKTLSEVIEGFIADPIANPLGNSRMSLNKRGMADEDLAKSLLDSAGCTRIAAHLTVDGAFNINSTDVESWTAMLSGLRGESFTVESGTHAGSNLTAFPRFRHPTGKANDNWNGFRTLDDSKLLTLAENLVKEVKARGPFLSLAEFVNRRVENSTLGRSGAIQSAIDAGKLNDTSKQKEFSIARYPSDAKAHIINDTGVGIPGYLTQADVLQSIAPVLTCRSDTFTIRAYGEAKDASGKVIARSWCEAVVQRTPDFVDTTNTATTPISSLTPINQSFGRRFDIISFRQVSGAEIL